MAVEIIEVVGSDSRRGLRDAVAVLLRRGVVRKEGPFAKELLGVGKDGKARGDGPIFDVGFSKRKLERSLAIAGCEIDREYFTAAKQVVGRIIQPEEGSANPGNAAVERNLLPALLRDLDRHVHASFFVVGAKVDVLVFINRIEIAELI